MFSKQGRIYFMQMKEWYRAELLALRTRGARSIKVNQSYQDKVKQHKKLNIFF